MFEDTINAFSKTSREIGLSILANGTDLFVYPRISDSVINSFQGNFALHLDEKILYARDTSFWDERNQGTVVTDWGITVVPDNDKPDEMIQVAWIDVISVEYSANIIYLFLDEFDRNKNMPIHISHLLKNKDDDSIVKTNGEALAYVFNILANTQMKETDNERFNRVSEEIKQALDNNDYEKALRIGLSYREEVQSAAFTPEVAWIYHLNGQNENALKILDEDFEALPEESKQYKSIISYYKSKIFESMGRTKEARKECVYVLNNMTGNVPYSDYFEQSINIREKSVNDFSKLESNYVRSFFEQPYNERKLIVPVKEYSDLSQKTISVVKMNNLPKIEFPIGHPIANQLYVGHPFIANKYYPFENYELIFLEDKVREFCQIVQSLGATEINIECINTSSSKRDVNGKQKISGEVNYKVASGSGEYNREKGNSFFDEISQKINLHQKYNPDKRPSLPDNLVWYKNEPSWQRLYSQRMEGSLSEHEERIETKKSQVVNNSDLKQISAEVKWLFINAKGNWDESMDEQFEGHDNAILSIHVNFAPLSQLEKPDTKTYSRSYNPSEEEYLDEVLECLIDDNEITSRERKLLDKLRVKLGISEKRAKELEESLKPNLTDDEKEYLDEYKECVENGEITPHTRRLLDKIRTTLGISEKRAKELESLIR